MPSNQAKVFKHKAGSFIEFARRFDASSIGLKGYQASYLNHLLSHLEYYTAIYMQVFKSALAHSEKPWHESTVVDYGCGNAMLGLFAKYCGCKTVICCDLDESSIDAAKKLSNAMNISIEAFVHGDVHSLEKILLLKNFKPGIITGTDVIEHIYDLEDFFTVLRRINSSQVNIFTTASNPANPFKVKEIRALQLRDELIGGKKVHINKQEDDLVMDEPYLMTREKMIRDFAPGLSQSEIEMLAIVTRGKRRNDIEMIVNGYSVTGAVPVIDTADTNTCDPVTGNWTERVVPLDFYSKVYNKCGFELSISNGFYNSFQGSALKKLLLKPMNSFIKNSGSFGRLFGTFYHSYRLPFRKHY